MADSSGRTQILAGMYSSSPAQEHVYLRVTAIRPSGAGALIIDPDTTRVALQVPSRNSLKTSSCSKLQGSEYLLKLDMRQLFKIRQCALLLITRVHVRKCVHGKLLRLLRFVAGGKAHERLWDCCHKAIRQIGRFDVCLAMCALLCSGQLQRLPDSPAAAIFRWESG